MFCGSSGEHPGPFSRSVCVTRNSRHRSQCHDVALRTADYIIQSTSSFVGGAHRAARTYTVPAEHAGGWFGEDGQPDPSYSGPLPVRSPVI